MSKDYRFNKYEQSLDEDDFGMLKPKLPKRLHSNHVSKKLKTDFSHLRRETRYKAEFEQSR